MTTEKIVICPYCDKQAEFMTSKAYYGKDYGTNMYVCIPCDATVGTHQRTDNPKGTLAKKELRLLRKSCHEKFDGLWRNGKMSRTEAYKWLASLMDMGKKEAHIGLFNESTCLLFLQRFEENEKI